MNNSSLLTADRMTHLKIVVIGLVCATLVAGLGIAAHVSQGAGNHYQATVTPAAKPVTASAIGDRTIR